MARTARDNYLSLTSVADAADVSTKTIRRRIADGTLPGYRIGGQVRIKESDLALLARRVPAVGVR